MRFQFLSAVAVSAVLISSPAIADDLVANATIVNIYNQAVGQAQLRQGAKGVLISVQLHEMQPGAHGMHFHAIGTCEDPALGFKASGDHTKNHNKNAQHGLLNGDGPENGDLPNIFVGADGTAQAEFYSTMISLNVQKNRDNLIDKDGSALVIHANADDHMAQPVGNSGDRIACGVIVGEATADQVQPQPGPPGPPMPTLTPPDKAAPGAETTGAATGAPAATDPAAPAATTEQTAPAPDAPAPNSVAPVSPAKSTETSAPKSEPQFTGSLGGSTSGSKR